MPFEMNHISSKVTEQKQRNKPLRSMRTSMRDINELLALRSDKSSIPPPQLHYIQQQVKNQTDRRMMLRSERD